MQDSFQEVQVCVIRRAASEQLKAIERFREVAWMRYYDNYVERHKRLLAHPLFRWFTCKRIMDFQSYVNHIRSLGPNFPDMCHQVAERRLSRFLAIADQSTGKMFLSLDDIYLLNHEKF